MDTFKKVFIIYQKIHISDLLYHPSSPAEQGNIAMVDAISHIMLHYSALLIDYMSSKCSMPQWELQHYYDSKNK